MSVFQIIIVTVIIIAVFCLVATLIGMWRFRKRANKDDPIQLAHLIREKTDKEEAGFSCRINQQSRLDINENINFPLESLTQIIVALDYANKASAKNIS